MKQMERGGNLDIFGTREYGQDVRTQNITAVSAVANIVKSSLGPVGLDKVCGRAIQRGRGGRRRRREALTARSNRGLEGLGVLCPPLALGSCAPFFSSLL